MHAIAIAQTAPSSALRSFREKLLLAGAVCVALAGLVATPAFAAAGQSTPATETTEKKVDLLKVIEGDRTLGNPDAPVTIIEYASLSCPHCASFHKDTFPLIQKEYIDTGKVFFIFRHFPFNEPALRGAQVTECSGDKYFTFLKALFSSQEQWAFGKDPVEGLRTIAGVGGMSSKDFDACIADKALEDRLISGVNWAARDLGVSSTPTLFINGEKIESARPFDFLAPKIDRYLSK